MKLSNPIAKIVTLSLFASVGLVSSCNEEERLTAGDTQDISEEAITDSYFQDADEGKTNRTAGLAKWFAGS